MGRLFKRRLARQKWRDIRGRINNMQKGLKDDSVMNAQGVKENVDGIEVNRQVEMRLRQDF